MNIKLIDVKDRRLRQVVMIRRRMGGVDSPSFASVIGEDSKVAIA